MNKLLKRGFNIYRTLLKNKLATAMMMFVSGLMMAISAANGHGNDTKTLPTIITAAGVLFSLWAFYRLGYIKANYDKLTDELQKDLEKRVFILQIVEALAYLVVTAAGIYLLMHESFTNLILNFMAGGFTIINGITGSIELYKKRQQRNARWIIRLILTLAELGLGTYFVLASNTIEISGLLAMGILTTIAGLIEIIFTILSRYDKIKDNHGKEE